MLSSDLRVDLNLAEEGTALTTTGEEVGSEEKSLGLESEFEQDTSTPLQTGQEGAGGAAKDTEDTEGNEEGEDEDEADEGEEPPLPLFGNG
jgi:hypothetical protein